MTLVGLPLEKTIRLTDLLKVGLATKPHEPALVSAKTRWTWHELEAASDRLARHLIGIGLKPGDRVASLMPNRVALVVHYLACVKAALVATPLNYRYQAPEIDHALGVTEAAIVLAHAERDADLAKSSLAGKLPLGRISYGADDERSPSFEQFLETEPPHTKLPTPDGTAPAFIFFTSGSTGKPKGVTHTHETFGWVLASCIAAMDITPADLMLPGSSLSHIGAMCLSLASLAAGARVDVARTFDGDELLPLLEKTQPTLLCMLPAALFCLVRDHGATRDHFASLRVCMAGGDKVSAELEREFTELAGYPIDEIYGMSEIGVATANPPAGIFKLGSIGRLVPGYAASVRDQGGNEMNIGREGRLWIQSRSNMVGYWNRPDATAETIVDGWLDTGDVVKADDDGYLWFEGRQKQIIIHDGSNICPQEVEDSLLEHPAVEAAGVVGIHHPVHGENVRAYIKLKAGGPRPTAAELIKFSRERVGYKAPEEIVVLNEMPLNATGKVDRVTLKKLAEARHTDVSIDDRE